MSFYSRSHKNKTIGLTLSGGGMRGIAHIAVLQALEEFNLTPAVISGTSAGAIVGAFYAYGKTPSEMMEIVRNETFFSRSTLRISRNGIFNPNFLLTIFSKYIPEDDFKALKIPLYVATSELTNGTIEYFCEGKLYEKLLATAAVPFVFPPVIIGNKFYVDGGVLNNLPTEPIQNKYDLLIGSHVNSMGYEPVNKMSTAKEFDRILHLAISNSVYSKKDNCDIFINPPDMLKYSIFKKDGLENMFQEVYQFTCEKLNAFKEEKH